MENIAVIHVIRCRNFTQNCLLLCVHLNGLVELFPWLGDLNVVIHGLGHTRSQWEFHLHRKKLNGSKSSPIICTIFRDLKWADFRSFNQAFAVFRLRSGMRWRMTENSTEQLKETSIRTVYENITVCCKVLHDKFGYPVLLWSNLLRVVYLNGNNAAERGEQY